MKLENGDLKLKYANLLKSILITILLVLPATQLALSQDKMPADKIGEIGVPDGKIAFIRGKDLWVMNIDGTQQMMVQEAQNCDGRLCWGPDNRQIVFTRSGKVDLKGPDWLGGYHKVYDLFIASLDSAEIGNTNFFRRVTDDVGSRDPQWTADNKIIFQKDMFGNHVNATMPNYQICIVDTNGFNVQILRDDWRMMSERFLVSPSMGPNGDIAFVFFFDMSPQGLVVLPRDKMMMSLDSIQARSEKNLKCVSPAWSPDGQWIAYVKNDINDGGLYICTPDMEERYLVFDPPVGTYLYTVPASFSPNSRWLTFSTTDGSIWICDIGGNNAKRLSGPGLDKWPAWSN
jgi:Tol biopolymer transport system component